MKQSRMKRFCQKKSLRSKRTTYDTAQRQVASPVKTILHAIGPCLINTLTEKKRSEYFCFLRVA